MTVMYWIEQWTEWATVKIMTPHPPPEPMTMRGAQSAERKVPGTEELSMQGG